jgi:uncharacterized membrane protein required for colicin V production
MNVVDVLVAITVAWSAWRGFARGLLTQACVVVAIAAGFAIALWCFAALAHGWGRGGREIPLALRFGVALFTGLLTFGLLQLAAERLGQKVNESIIGPFNRVGGLLLGTITGLSLATLLLLVAVSAPLPGSWPGKIRGVTVLSWSAPRLFAYGERVASEADPYLPGGGALVRAFGKAARTHPIPAERRAP